MCPCVAAMLDRCVLGGRCPPSMLPGGSFRPCLLGVPPVGPMNLADPDDPVVAGGFLNLRSVPPFRPHGTVTAAQVNAPTNS